MQVSGQTGDRHICLCNDNFAKPQARKAHQSSRFHNPLASLRCVHSGCGRRFNCLSSLIQHLECNSNQCLSQTHHQSLTSPTRLHLLADFLISPQLVLGHQDRTERRVGPQLLTVRCPLCQEQQYPAWLPTPGANYPLPTRPEFSTMGGLIQHVEDHPLTYARDLQLRKAATYLESIVGHSLVGCLWLLQPSQSSIWV